jgi:hypothetical protein
VPDEGMREPFWTLIDLCRARHERAAVSADA